MFVPKGPINNIPALVSIGSDNGLLPGWHQAIIWTNADPVYRHIYVALGWEDLIHILHNIFKDTQGPCSNLEGYGESQIQ